MSDHALFRFSGGVLIVGGVSGSLAHILHLQYHPSQPAEVLPYVGKSEPVHVLLFVAVLLVLMGLPALLVRQLGKIGILGLAGFVLLYFGLVLGEWLHCVLEIGIYPAMAQVAPNEMITVVNQMYEGRSPYAVLEFVGGWLLLLGALMVGIAMLSSRTFPRWNALLLLATDLGALLAFTPWTHWMVGGRWPVVFYLALVAVGYSLFKNSKPREQRLCTMKEAFRVSKSRIIQARWFKNSGKGFLNPMADHPGFVGLVDCSQDCKISLLWSERLGSVLV